VASGVVGEWRDHPGGRNPNDGKIDFFFKRKENRVNETQQSLNY